MDDDLRRALALPERHRNAVLRRLDWRFLLRGREAPGPADLIEVGFPTGRALSRARNALRPGGEVVCFWKLPRLAGPRRARARLRAAGFEDARVYWAGPIPWRLPQFWLPLESPAAIESLLASRPAAGRPQAALRAIWRAVARLGALAPLYAIASAPGEDPAARRDSDPVGDELASTSAVTLLTGGRRSINKVVGIGFREGRARPSFVAKSARVPEAVEGLEREAAVLERLERQRPELAAVPRLRAVGRRAGMLTVVESVVEGRPLLETLTPETFPELAAVVTDLLIELAGGAAPEPASVWRERLVEGPVARLAQGFGAVLAPTEVSLLRRRLADLGDLPVVCEHRDCSPWNVVLDADGAPALLDWESAEPDGLPALDLVYFLANAVFLLDGALEAGRTATSYARLLDPTTAAGLVVEACLRDYAARIGISSSDIARLRLLCWVVHCPSDLQHLELEGAGPPEPAALGKSPFLALLREELRALGGDGEGS